MAMAQNIIEEIQAGGGVQQWALSHLPTPHLLDSTWWFDSTTVNRYRKRFVRLPFARIACLGTPTLFVDAAMADHADRLWLFDRDRTIGSHLPLELASRFTAIDLTAETPVNLEADFVIADPPWYEFEMKSFIAAAEKVSKLGATIELSIPPPETRPDIENERQRIFDWAKRGGLNLIRIIPSAVRYNTPPFEHNALRSAGAQVAADWRVGDLALFKVARKNGLSLPVQAPQRGWTEVQLLKTRWRIGEHSDISVGDSRLVEMGWNDDIFPSCSRRHPERDMVDVWTSGNRAFRCRDPKKLLAIADSLKANDLPGVLSCAKRIRHSQDMISAITADQIVKVLEIEQNEIEVFQRYA
jgi:hypothetical protein